MLDHILKRRLPERIIRKLTRHPMLVVSVTTLGVRLGKDAYAMREGEIDAPEFRKRAGAHLGHMSGGLAGAAAGAAAGSVLPGLGTLLGAFAGGMVGEHLGGKAGRAAAELAESRWGERPPTEGPRGPFDPPKRHL
jgi:phage tail tape-measure protein